MLYGLVKEKEQAEGECTGCVFQPAHDMCTAQRNTTGVDIDCEGYILKLVEIENNHVTGKTVAEVVAHRFQR